MRKILKTVTVTGADDSTSIHELSKIVHEFPFVEFAILLSKSSEGHYRFPSLWWMTQLAAYSFPINLSGHLCGKWVRDTLDGKETFWEERNSIATLFKRIQLNFHAQVHKVDDWSKLFNMLKKHPSTEFIFQLDGVNDELVNDAKKEGVTAFPFFDRSGGIGELPEEWPKMDGWHGVAGGLSPDNLEEQLTLIEKNVDSPIWIDAETHLRSADNSIFDLEKVRKFLQIAEPWVI